MYFTLSSSVSIVDVERENVNWVTLTFNGFIKNNSKLFCCFFLIRDDVVGNMFSLTHLMLPFTGFSCMDPPNICYGAFVLLFKVFVSFKRCLGMLNLFKAVIIV